MMWKILLYALIGYTALCGIVFIFQHKLLYMPDHTKVSKVQAMDNGLNFWPSFDNFQGLITQTGLVEPKGTIIVFHGNAGTALDRNFYASALSRQAYRVILSEYPGYGGRLGKPSENVLAEDAIKTIHLAYQAYGEPLILWGESLGCGVVASAVQQTRIPVKGVVLFLPWDSLTNLAQTHYPFLPVKWLIKDKYDSVENLKGFTGNIGVILAGNDEIIPVKHGKNLYESIRANKKLWVFDNATHNEMPVAPGLPWWEEVISFISE
ncbi:MAG: alpha/beta fold hydrolase [Pseudomonadota bacterium]